MDDVMNWSDGAAFQNDCINDIFEKIAEDHTSYLPTIFWTNDRAEAGALYFDSVNSGLPVTEHNKRLTDILKLLDAKFIVTAFLDSVGNLVVCCENGLFAEITVYDVSLPHIPEIVQHYRGVTDTITGNFLHLLRNVQTLS